MSSASDPLLAPRRARLLSLLSEACELEHALACSYLFAAFTIKRDIAEGIDWQEQQRNRRWASEIYHVAAQEMLHLAQAWNLLAAVGGTPYYDRPNYPLPARWYPLKVALVLRRFDADTMARFVLYETPVDELDRIQAAVPARDELPDEWWRTEESTPYRSVGELYGQIRELIGGLDEDELFLRTRGAQVGAPIVDFYDIVRVYDRESAFAAVDLITSQGEGTTAHREDTHYGAFKRISAELEAVVNDPDATDPFRPVGDNPYYRYRRDQIPAPFVRQHQGGVELTELTDTRAILAVDLFDDCYVAMLQALGYVFQNAAAETEDIKPLAKASLELMTTVLKPLGEAICLLPSGTDGANAGPTFSLGRHAQLPVDPPVATTVFRERIAELAGHGELLGGRLSGASPLAEQWVHSATTNLRAMAEGLHG